MHPDFSHLESEFGDVMDLLSDGPLPELTEHPGEDVWAAISAGLGDELSGGGADRSQHTGGGPRSTVGEILEGGPALAAVPPPAGHADPAINGGFDHAAGNVHELRRIDGAADGGRSPVARRFAVVTAMAAAFLLVAVPLTLALRGDGLDQRAELLALGEGVGVASGTAELTDRQLVLDLDGLAPLEGASYELWLLDLEGDEVEALESLGLVQSEDGTFTVPAGIDLSEYSVVDVSIEPDDGDPTHSGNSVLRGGLTDV
ncbi:MAG: anti-sigma factor [Actinomycetota bacterium]